VNGYILLFTFAFLRCFPYLGNIYITDALNNRIRKVTVSTGIITTVAGTGTASYSGDNDQATSATLYHPHDVALDSAGTSLQSLLYFSSYLTNSPSIT